MTALYITSLEGAAGKTTVGAGLGKHLMASGNKVGFLKLLTTDAEGSPAGNADSDAVFMKRILALKEPIEVLCLVISRQDNLVSDIKEAYAKVAKGKDVVIVEGAGGRDTAYTKIVDALDTRVVVVAGYSDELSMASLATDSKDCGAHLLGVVLNKVPKNHLERVAGQVSGSGVSILGVLPEDRALFALTVGELAEHVHGKILNGTDRSGELVENIMLGAMTVDHGPEYFGRKDNKAVIVRGERPDMQLAALETPTTCLVISGDTEPISSVVYGAESQKVPIIITRDDIVATVTDIENALGKTRFNQESKVARLTDIMERYFNFPVVYRGLDLTD